MTTVRGYIGSRPPFGCDRTPQHVQNIVLRDYANRKRLTYLLSAVEYTMPGCYQILESVLHDLDAVDGILAYSLFMFPEDAERRHAIYERVLGAGKVLCFALEDMTLESAEDVERLEDLWAVQTLVARGDCALP